MGLGYRRNKMRTYLRPKPGRHDVIYRFMEDDGGNKIEGEFILLAPCQKVYF